MEMEGGGEQSAPSSSTPLTLLPLILPLLLCPLRIYLIQLGPHCSPPPSAPPLEVGGAVLYYM
jgi:hypothetical protein